MNRARGLPGWAGKEHWEQGPRGSGGGSDSRGNSLAQGMQELFWLGDRETSLVVSWEAWGVTGLPLICITGGSCPLPHRMCHQPLPHW